MEALAKIGLAEFYQLPSPVAWRMRFFFGVMGGGSSKGDAEALSPIFFGFNEMTKMLQLLRS